MPSYYIILNDVYNGANRFTLSRVDIKEGKQYGKYTRYNLITKRWGGYSNVYFKSLREAIAALKRKGKFTRTDPNNQVFHHYARDYVAGTFIRRNPKKQNKCFRPHD